MIRFAAVFMLLLAASFALELTPPVQAALVAPWTEGLARLSAALVTMFDPNVAAFMSSYGARGATNGGNSGTVFMRLKPRKERKVSVDEFIQEIRPKLAKIPIASVDPIASA